MNESGNLVAEAAVRIFQNFKGQSGKGERTSAHSYPLWAALEEAGLPLAWVPEELGGSNVGLYEGFQVARVAGRHAIEVPLVDTMLAAWMLSAAQIKPPEGAIAMAPPSSGRLVLDSRGRLHGNLARVPHASDVAHLACLAESPAGAVIALIRCDNCRIEKEPNISPDPRCRVDIDNVEPVVHAPVPRDFDAESVSIMGMTARSLQIAGALEAALELAVTYASQREAFGRTISKFQAVQHNLARLASETAAAVTVSCSAADSIAESGAPSKLDEGALLEVLSSKIRTAEAAETGMAIAHQIFGAIGFTTEHPLHKFTLRALSWRDDFGNDSEAAVVLGRRIAQLGPDELWPLLASR